MNSIDTRRLRCWIGWLGMALPWIVVLLQLLNKTFKWPASISATWYTNACTSFMIILGSAGILLMCYRGYDYVDDALNTCGGLFGLGICIFPCQGPMKLLAETGTFLIPAYISNIFHMICAIIFFCILSYNSLFQFTKGSTTPTKNKKIRNIIFRVCGIGMIASFAILLLPNVRIKVWLTETIALSFFGISWLTKANCYKWLFCD